VVKFFKQYDKDLVEKLVVLFQAALDFAAWFGYFEETNCNVSQIINQGPRMIKSEDSQAAKAPQ
jgi:hypothetical protein